MGMVGALSIVRFRTAIKDPMDLVFLFWSISIGIICGAGMAEIAILASLLLTAALFLFDRLPIARAPMILTIHYANSEELDEQVMQIVGKYARYYKVKSRSVKKSGIDLVLEVRVSEEIKLTRELTDLEGVSGAALLSHDGEVTF